MELRHKIYHWLRVNTFRVDLVLMLSILLFCGPPYLMAGRPWQFVLSSALVVPLAWRRTRPVHAAAAVVLACLVLWAAGLQPLAGLVAVPLTIYAVAAYGPAWASRAVLGAGMLGGVLLTTRNLISTVQTGVLGLTTSALYTVLIWMLVLFSWTLGDLTRVRRQQVRTLADRARRLEIERQHERSLAAADERAHIAREMHDIVAHSLSVIITQSDGARYAAAANPAVATETLATVATTARTSLAEMRRLLGVLRHGDESATRPLPGLADLEELFLGFRAAGLPLAVEQSGAPRRTLPAGAELTAYRVLQESLTNVLKHAGPVAKARASVRWQQRGLQIDVHDDGRGASADSAGTAAGAGGNGLRGMRERINLYDGSLAAGPAAGGGFQVTAFLPYTEA